MQIICAIIDDEPLARKVIRQYLEQVSWAELVFEEANPLEAINKLRECSVDLLFLDIKMPGISGLDFLNIVKEKPDVILTTAYREFALEGFEHEVLDYLLKPISFERFLKAINKVHRASPDSTLNSQDASFDSSILIKQDKKYFKIELRDITHIEGMKDYVKIHTLNESYITHSTMTKMLESLGSPHFMRVQKSFIINLYHFQSLEGNTIQLSKGQIVLGRTFRESFIKRINQEL